MDEVNLNQNERSYINVMESLVAQEVRRQLQDVPTRVRRYLKMQEVVTYALNRLPAMYASSQKGWQYQRQMAKREMHHQIQNTVRQAIVAIQIDPLRLSRPIRPTQNPDAEAVLQALRALFQAPKLDWETALNKLNGLQTNPLSIEQIFAQSTKTQQPNIQTSQVTWTHRHRRPTHHRDLSPPPSESLKERHPSGWDNGLYRL